MNIKWTQPAIRSDAELGERRDVVGGWSDL